jgi:hypothetical protein
LAFLSTLFFLDKRYYERDGTIRFLCISDCSLFVMNENAY